MPKDSFGYGTYQEGGRIFSGPKGREYFEKLKPQIALKANLSLLAKFMPDVNEEIKLSFLNGNIREKESILKQYANDTDDALWRSDEWMFLTTEN